MSPEKGQVRGPSDYSGLAFPLAIFTAATMSPTIPGHVSSNSATPGCQAVTDTCSQATASTTARATAILTAARVRSGSTSKRPTPLLPHMVLRETTTHGQDVVTVLAPCRAL